VGEKSIFNGDILKTTDGGISWNSQTSGTGTLLNSVYFLDEDTGWVVGSGGTILKTINGGATWETQSSGAQHSLSSIYFIDNNTGWTVGGGGTILKTNDAITQNNEKGYVLNQMEYHLAQNYPNPFNPITIIKYQIPTQSFVTLKVYDVLGNEIETLISEEKPVGSYKCEFYANKFPSGVYFYRLQAGSFVETKKMVLLR
jgi:hypothetical protein